MIELLNDISTAGLKTLDNSLTSKLQAFEPLITLFADVSAAELQTRTLGNLPASMLHAFESLIKELTDTLVSGL